MIRLPQRSPLFPYTPLFRSTAAGAEPREPAEHRGVARQQLDQSRARAHGRQEALHLVERLVGIGALPDGVEQVRQQPLHRAAERRLVRNEWPALEDQPEIVAGALGITKAGGL